MLDNEDKFLIILEAIKDYKKGENDIAILLVEKLTQKLATIEIDTDTVELYKEVEDTFDLYNQFIKLRGAPLTNTKVPLSMPRSTIREADPPNSRPPAP